MPTFLTTPKMEPELAARVEASVTGKPAMAKMSPKTVAFLRFAGIAGFVGMIVWIFVVRRQAADAIAADRNALLAQVRVFSEQLTEADKKIIPRAEAWVAERSGAYEGDFIDESVRGEGMKATFAQPILYLRGPIDNFKTAQGITEMAQTTFRDAFVLCLFDPPAKATEKTLREAARAISNAERAKVMEHVARFHTARVGVPFLVPQWEERVKTIDASRELNEIRSLLKRVNLEESVKALKARLLLVAMDEPKDGTGPSEIDGANRHYVRVFLHDFETDKPLLRRRILVDPAWIATSRRSDHAHGINSCELALEVRAAMSGTAAPTRE